MTEVLRNLGSSAAVYYGNLAGIWVMVLHRPPGETDMLMARPALTRMAKSEPRGFPTLTWVLRSAGLSLEPAAKDAASKITTEFAKSILCRATLIEGSGFQAAAVRSIVAGIDLFSRTTSPGKVFAELEGSLDWSRGFLAEGGAKSPPSRELALALNDEVARLGPAAVRP